MDIAKNILMFSSQEMVDAMDKSAVAEGFTVMCPPNEDDDYLLSITEVCPYAVIFEISQPVYKIQNLFADLQEQNMRMHFLVFRRMGNELYYVMSNENAQTGLAELETFFYETMSETFSCVRMYHHDETWRRFFKLDESYYQKQECLADLLRGTTEQEYADKREKFRLNLRQSGFYLFVFDLAPIEYSDHDVNKNVYWFVGYTLIGQFFDVLADFNGGEVLYYTPNLVYIFINDIDIKSITLKNNRFSVLKSRLCSIGSCRTARLYISQQIWSIENLRSAYADYQNDRNYKFFCSEIPLMSAEQMLKTQLNVKYAFINELLARIKDTLQYKAELNEAKTLIEELLLHHVKKSYNFGLYYYCHDSIIAFLDELFGHIVSERSATVIMADMLRYTSIEQECAGIINLLETLYNRKHETSKGSFVYDTIAIIKKSYMEDIHVSDIAVQLHVSSTYLSKIFKGKTGQSVIKFLINYRVDQAKKMLVSTNDSITIVALKSGFQDARHFSKTFSRIVGMSPREYRKNTQ